MEKQEKVVIMGGIKPESGVSGPHFLGGWVLKTGEVKEVQSQAASFIAKSPDCMQLGAREIELEVLTKAAQKTAG